MGYARHNNSDVQHQLRCGVEQTLPTLLGCFRHKETGASFEYAQRLDSDTHWAPELPHLIYMIDGSTRYATVKHTVCYVAIDEDEHGRPVLERWPLKSHRPFPTDWVYA